MMQNEVERLFTLYDHASKYVATDQRSLKRQYLFYFPLRDKGDSDDIMQVHSENVMCKQ